MSAFWHRYELPTWLVAGVIYASWIALAVVHAHISPPLLVALAVFVTAWHASLQHETIHAMRRVPRPLRTLLAFPPLGIWFPYELVRREHLRHHVERNLTGPDDPESFYFAPAAWAALPVWLRALHRANRTLLGRMVLGPALMIAGMYARGLRDVVEGKRGARALWMRHGVACALLLLLLALGGIAPLAYLALVAYPAASLGLLRSFVEHHASGEASERTVTVESSGVLALLFLNNNLHAAHHDRPALPWYELPRHWREQRARLPPARFTRYRSVVATYFFRAYEASYVLPLSKF